MFTGQVDVISNKATWQSDVVELVDEDDGTTADLADPLLTVDVVVTIKDIEGCTTLATASLANGKAVIVGPGFSWQFEVDDLTCLGAGTYRLGVKVTIDDVVIDLIDGTVTVIEGN